jgi:NAD(P)H-hydrate epimerase
VETFLLAPRETIKGDALINLLVLEKMTSQIFPVTDEASLAHAAFAWHDADVIVDAILGTGLTSDVRSPYREAIERINGAPGVRLAVDIPSGLDADTGKVRGVAVHADLTATYGFMKLGMALHPGVDYCGTVEVVDISIPLNAVENNPPAARLHDRVQGTDFWRLRADPEAHKGTFGHLLIVGGSPGKTGAPAMAARAAGRMGTGLVTVGVPASLNPILEAKLTEEMTEPLPESIPGYLGEPSTQRILALAQNKRCVVLGPGLSAREGIPEMARELLAQYEGWLVIDADGLNVLVGSLDAVKTARGRLVLTPHPAEMGRLTGLSTREVQDDRVGVARRTARDLNAWIVLKGARTIIAAPDGRIFVNTSGNPWMASGGQGDVLSGILGALLAQGLPPDDALPFGVHLHSLAADKIVEQRGPHPVQAMDVIDGLPALLGELAPHKEI